MRFRERLRLWWRTRRRRRTAKKLAHAPLREFVYLDEVSVYSLIAARRGALATEFTETESSSLTSELGGSFGASGGLAKAEVDSRVAAREARGSQVVRKSIVQATFKDLFEYEQDKMAIRASGNAVDPPPVASADELARLGDNPPQRHLVSDEALRRGELLELGVELGSEAVFRASTVMSMMLEFSSTRIPSSSPRSIAPSWVRARWRAGS